MQLKHTGICLVFCIRAHFIMSHYATYSSTIHVPCSLPASYHAQQLHGATVTSYRTAQGREVLFLSKTAIYNGAKAIRGQRSLLVYLKACSSGGRLSSHTTLA